MEQELTQEQKQKRIKEALAKLSRKNLLNPSIHQKPETYRKLRYRFTRGGKTKIS